MFFLTASQLAPQDEDQAFDIYDAHECTAASPCTSQAAAAVPPACTNEASCKAAPETQPQGYGLPSSATFSGPGNLTPPRAGGRETRRSRRGPKSSQRPSRSARRTKEAETHLVRKGRAQGLCGEGKRKKSSTASRANNDRRVSR